MSDKGPLRALVDDPDEGPFAAAAEPLVMGFLETKIPAAIGACYHDMVAALLRPEDAEVVLEVRRLAAAQRAATARRGSPPSDPILVQLHADVEAVITRLGVEPVDFETEMLPTIKVGVRGMLHTAEEFVGEKLTEALVEMEEEKVILLGPPGSTGRPN